MKRSSLRDHQSRDGAPTEIGGWRLWLVGAVLTLCGLSLLARAVYLQVIDQDFLAKQGDARILRDVKLSANRGMVLDRNGEPLAVSTPVERVMTPGWSPIASLA